MKFKLLVLFGGLLVLSLFITSCATGEEDYAIYNTATGDQVSLREMAAAMAEHDVVLFGEYHGNEIIHRLQARVLPYYLGNAEKIAISMEMFERDIQGVLNKYLAGEIEEDEFQSEARAWPNYASDYRPIIEFARREDLPVIAANVPRRYAAEVSRNGLSYIQEIPEEERDYLAREVSLTDDTYKESFYDIMKVTPHMERVEEEEYARRLRNIYAAQSLKDDTMAESIIDHKKENPREKIIHFTGDFHIRNHLGITTKIRHQAPQLHIVNISPYLIGEGEKFEFSEELRNIADFIIVLSEQTD